MDGLLSEAMSTYRQPEPFSAPYVVGVSLAVLAGCCGVSFAVTTAVIKHLTRRV
jgi:hypothetical protein